jgi:glycosyltransferase involved in cell wall biosynthesis
MPYIKQADCFVLPSLYEGYPTTVIESFFAGTPVLACDVSGVYEQIQEGHNGWVVNNSQEALNERLIELVRNPERLKPMREHLVEYHYDNASIFERFMKAVEGQV